MDEILDVCEKIQYECFKSALKDKMDIKFYLCIFFKIFLGDEYFPASEPEFKEMEKMCKTQGDFDIVFPQYCRQIISQIDLSEPERKFFISMTENLQPNIFIENCIETYHTIAISYQLKPLPNILKCLEVSKGIIYG